MATLAIKRRRWMSASIVDAQQNEFICGRQGGECNSASEKWC